MSTLLSFTLQSGVPFSRIIRVVDGKDLWSALGDFEVRSELRATQHEDAELIAELHPYMDTSYDLNDILITWMMNGAVVRTLRSGYYDIFLSDPGAADEKAIRILNGPITWKPAITTAGD